jgi:anaerobic magnesium-protoporphyrin IX monomethyl ester cyclase
MLAGQEIPFWAGVKGIAYKEDGKVVVNMERPFIRDLDRFNPRWDKIPVERYLIPSGPYTRAIPVYISRGCPFRCGFCYNEVVMKRTWRQHTDEFILRQVQWLKDHYQIDAIDYADDYLFGRIKPMQRLVEKVGMPWSGQVRVQLLSLEFVKWMKDTGCQWVNIGAESGSQAVLDNIHKDQKAWQIEWGMKNLTEVAPHIEANLSFIIGLPGEKGEDTKVTFEVIEKVCDMNEKARCSVCVYMPYPGTPLWPQALAMGYIPPDNQEGWCNFDLNRGNTPWMDDGEAQVMSDVNDILFVGRSKGAWLLTPYYKLLRWRWHNRYFRHYWEGSIKKAIANSPLRGALAWIIQRTVEFNPITHKGPATEASGLSGD